MKWLFSHILWILGLVQVVLACAAGATDLFGANAMKIVLFSGGLVTAIVGFIKANPPPVDTIAKCVPLLLAMSIVLTGCQSLGLPAPQGFDQQLAQAYGIHTAVVSATATALTAGSISANDAQSVQGLERNARTLLDTAKAAETAGDAAGAQKDLVLATTALTALQAYINAHGSK